jgi:putative colanic acid biosynthesis UDP-glucose lipid carrier transferase
MLPKGLLKEYSRTMSFILRGLDVFAIVVSGLIAYFYKFGDLDLPLIYINALLVGAILTLVVFPFSRIYESMRGQSFWVTIKKLIQSVLTVLIFLAGLAFITKTGNEFSREWFIDWTLFAFILLVISRSSLLIILRLMRSRGWNERRVVIIGAGELATRLVKTIHEAGWTGFHVVTIFDDQSESQLNSLMKIPVKKTPADLNAFVTANKDKIDEIWIALPLRAEERVKALLYDLRHHTIAIRYILDIFGLGLLNHSVIDLVGFPAVNLNSSPMVGINRIIKAIEDRVLAALILILISPLFLLIAIGVKLSSKGPVFFKQFRHGWDGKVIKVYKFRTMVQHKEESGKITQAKANDTRVTKFGRFLRRTSLDELPQFFNVLQGRMSIVGPRPHAIEHNEYYKNSIDAYMQRHKVKPGITGWAQVNGWRGETETIDKMQKRVEYDLYYIENWSLGFDLKIIMLTVFQGFTGRNAY